MFKLRGMGVVRYLCMRLYAANLERRSRNDVETSYSDAKAQLTFLLVTPVAAVLSVPLLLATSNGSARDVMKGAVLLTAIGLVVLTSRLGRNAFNPAAVDQLRSKAQRRVTGLMYLLFPTAGIALFLAEFKWVELLRH
jgi:hypothetical protein